MRVYKILSNVIRAAALSAVAFFFSFCGEKDYDIGIDPDEEGISYSYPGKREPIVETRRVLLFYECGFNSLTYDLDENMTVDLPKGYIPGDGRHEDVLLIYSKFALNASYKDVPSYLRRVFKNDDGEIVSDTLKVYPATTVAASGETLTDVLTTVRATFPAKGYGMVFSSHGSGWLPTGYFNNPSAFEYSHRNDSRKLSRARRSLAIPEGNLETDDPYASMVRSIGQDKMSSGDVEMSTEEFSGAIPFRLDYLLFDMCFGGGIEVVYALKDKADYIGVSPAEVLAAGAFDYTKITGFLFNGSSPDLTGLFKDSFERYNSMQGVYRSATVTLLKSEGLDNVAEVCEELISKYPDQLENVRPSTIQGYFRQNRHYFYDLEDIFAKSGVPEEDMNKLRNALDQCIVYKAATPSFMEVFDINTYSGLSMYLPCAGTNLLDSYYKKEAWNKAVELVK